MNSPATPRLPEQLTVGTHLTLDDGACLMECVSVLAGQPWSDAPTTTHPLLAHLGRLANDAMTSAGRQSLRPLASRLARLNSSDPAIHGAIAELATRYGLQVRPTPAVAWMHASALRHVRLSNRPAPGGRARGTLRQLRLRAYRRGPAYRALEAAVVTLCRASDSDGHLQACTRAGGRPGGDQRLGAHGGLRAGHHRADAGPDSPEPATSVNIDTCQSL